MGATMAETLKERIKQFEKFYHFLMKEAPKNYTPWFFPLQPKGKDPSPQAILNIDSTSKGSWHHESARLTKEQCIEHLKKGYNIGLSARKEDPLIIIDIDEAGYLDQTPTDTLTVTSRKRAGSHSFCWDKDGTAKINLPTDGGEIRSDNQYVVAVGSCVPFDLENKKDKKAFNKLPKEAKEDKLLGHYTIKECLSPKEISFSELPKFFVEKEMENIEAEAGIKNKNEEKSFKGDGKYSELFNLKVSDIVGLIPANKRQGHPLHESDTDANFSLSKDGKIAHCWRHLVSLNATQYLCVKAGYKSCVDCGTPHKGRGISKIQGDSKAYEIAYQEALKLGLIKEYKEKKKVKINVAPTKVFTRKGQSEIFQDVQPYFFDKSKMFWIWDAKTFAWKVSDDIDILNMIEESTGQDIISSKNRQEILNALKQQGRKYLPKPIKPTWIQFKEKILDYTTGEVLQATPEYFVTNPIPWDVSEFENTPVMDKIFEEWVGKEYVQTLYEILAYSLVPDYPLHRLFCFIGSGLNGKSKFLQLLRKFVGLENVTSTELDVLLKSRFEITKLHKKLVCQMGETNFAEMSKTSILKKLTGQDSIGFEYKNKTPFDDHNYAKILIATNNLPTTTDKTIGFYRRWLIIDFPNQFSEQVDILETIPEEEYNALASKCIILLKNLLEKREFHNEGSIEDREKKFEEKSNPVSKFLDEFTTVKDPNENIKKWELEKTLNEWLTENRHRKMSVRTINKHMKERGIEPGRVTESWYEDDNEIKKQVRVWEGIKWKE